MNEHLTDQQMDDSLSGPLSEAAVWHLAECRACASEFARLKDSIADYSVLIRDEAEERQLRPFGKKALRGKLHAPRLMWIAAVVLLATAFSLLHWTPTQPQQRAAAPSPDDTLLLEIQQDLNREVPRALAPALVLTAERNRIIGQVKQEQNR